MALSALEIYKFLPKTNCKKCGLPTCLAFAMKLAAKQIELSQCPEISEEAKKALDSLSEPPMRTIKISSAEKEINTGGELVLFRHEKKFYNPTGLGVLVEVSPESNFKNKIEQIDNLTFEKVGEYFKIDIIALQNLEADSVNFLEAIELADAKGYPLVLISSRIEDFKEGIKILKNKKPLIYPYSIDNIEDFYNLAKEHELPIVISGNNYKSTILNVEQILKNGYKNLVLDLNSHNVLELLVSNTLQRRLAISRGKKSAGFPTITLVRNKGNDIYKKLAYSSIAIAKYSDILIADCTEEDFWDALITLRFNIYTDPQKPVTVEPKLYSIGNPDKESPLLVTTNFSLTYYTVSPEIENSKIPSYLLVVDTEGMSVLTAWAADKFNAEIISQWMKKTEVENFVQHRKIIIPGYVAVLSGKLEELSGWNIIVGPKEASGIPKFLKEVWK